MSGLGFALRNRPTRNVAWELGIDLLAGRDYQGDRRAEVPFMASVFGYANPRDAAQFYVLGGIGFSYANVERDDAVRDYRYFGGHLGLGMEFRLSRPVSLNLDLLGFIRGRIDGDASGEPEFVDRDTGRTTNMSGGGLLRFGVTFYW